MDYKFTFDDGSEGIYHADHKYIRKFMQNGKWVYEYAADKAKNAAKKVASGPKWLVEAVKNDLTGVTDKAALDLHRAQRDAALDDDFYDYVRQTTRLYRNEAEKWEKAAREKESRNESSEYERKKAHGARQAAIYGSRTTADGRASNDRAHQKASDAQYAYDNTPSLKRKVSELLRKKKKKK